MLSTDIRRAGGQRLPQPLRLVMHLPAGHPAGHQTSRERANHVNSRPLHPPWAATRIGIEYVGISRRDRPVFLPDFDASGRTRTWVLPMEGERHNHYATCLTSRRRWKKKEVTWSARATTLQNDDQKKRAVRNAGHHPKAMYLQKIARNTPSAPTTHTRTDRACKGYCTGVLQQAQYASASQKCR